MSSQCTSARLLDRWEPRQDRPERNIALHASTPLRLARAQDVRRWHEGPWVSCQFGTEGHPGAGGGSGGGSIRVTDRLAPDHIHDRPVGLWPNMVSSSPVCHVYRQCLAGLSRPQPQPRRQHEGPGISHQDGTIPTAPRVKNTPLYLSCTGLSLPGWMKNAQTSITTLSGMIVSRQAPQYVAPPSMSAP